MSSFRTMRRPVIAATGLITLLAVSGCGDDGAKDPGADPGSNSSTSPPGDDLTTKGAGSSDDGAKVTKVGKRFVIKPSTSTKAIISLDSYKELPEDADSTFPPKSGTYTVFTIRIKAVKGPAHYNYLYLKLKTPDGKTVTPLDGNASYIDVEPEVRPTDIATGKTITAAIALDVKVKPGSKLLYTNTLRRVVATWRL